MTSTIQFDKDFDAFHHAIETDRFFFYKLNKEVFNRRGADQIDSECFYEGNYHNSHEIQRVIRHVVGIPAIVKDKIDDNGYLRYIDIEFVCCYSSLPKIHINVDYELEEYSLTESQYLNLDEYLNNEDGMNYMFTIVLDAIYTMLEDKPKETFTYNCS